MRRSMLTTLGGPGTFADQAATEIQRRHPRYAGSIAYEPTVDAVWNAFDHGAAARVVLGAVTQHTGFNPELVRRLAMKHEPPVWVEAEAIVRYGCRLLGKAGTRLDEIRTVVGHGSLVQCVTYLDANLPGAAQVRHPGSSLAAAREVAGGDGSTAVIGTAITARATGLATLATDIDGGASAAWWVLARDAELAREPSRVIVAGRVSGSGDLGTLIARLVDIGLRLRGCSTVPSGTHLFDADAVLDLEGAVALASVRAVVSKTPSARIAGAFSP